MRAIGARVRVEDAPLWVLSALLIGYATFDALNQDAIDFGTIWLATQHVLDGVSPYAPVTHGGDYVHSPASTLLSMPFGLLSQVNASRLVIVFSAAAFVIAALLASVGTGASARATAIGVLAFALSGPLRKELGLANVDIICLLPLAAALIFLSRGRPLVAGAFIAVALTIKPTMVLFILLPLCMGSFAGTAMAGAVVVVAELVALPFVPGSSRFFTSVLPFVASGKTTGFNVSLSAALERAGLPHAMVLGVRVVAFAALVWLYLRYRRVLRERLGAMVAVLVFGTILVVSYYFGVYLVYAVLALAVIDIVRRPGERVVLAAAAYLMLNRDVLRSSHHALDVALSFRYSIGAMLMLGLLVVVLERERRFAASGSRDDGELPSLSDEAVAVS